MRPGTEFMICDCVEGLYINFVSDEETRSLNT